VLLQPLYAGDPSPRGFLDLYTSLTKPPLNGTSLFENPGCN
jgi:hypothetical protein